MIFFVIVLLNLILKSIKIALIAIISILLYLLQHLSSLLTLLGFLLLRLVGAASRRTLLCLCLERFVSG